MSYRYVLGSIFGMAKAFPEGDSHYIANVLMKDFAQPGCNVVTKLLLVQKQIILETRLVRVDFETAGAHEGDGRLTDAMSRWD